MREETQQQTHGRFKPSNTREYPHALAAMHRVPDINMPICIEYEKGSSSCTLSISTNGVQRDSWRIDAVPVLPGVTHLSDHDQHVHAHSIAHLQIQVSHRVPSCDYRVWYRQKHTILDVLPMFFPPLVPEFPGTCALVPIKWLIRSSGSEVPGSEHSPGVIKIILKSCDL